MSLQFLLDGLIAGSMIGLGAIGVTLTYSILRFSNFAHGDFMAWGAYATLTLSGLIGGLFGAAAPLGPLSFGLPLIVAGARWHGADRRRWRWLLDWAAVRPAARARGRRSSW